jgi:hypothetical protein
MIARIGLIAPSSACELLLIGYYVNLSQSIIAQHQEAYMYDSTVMNMNNVTLMTSEGNKVT